MRRPRAAILAGFLAMSCVFAFATRLEAAAADDAAALLAQHRAFVGWQEGDGTFTSWRAKGKNISEIRRGAIYRTTIGSLPRQADEGFTGRAYWSADLNGNVVRLYEDDARFQISTNAIFGEATTSLPGKSRGTKDLDGQSYPVVQVEPKLGFPIDLYIDPKTGAYKMAVIDPGGSNEAHLHIESYLDVAGKKVIGSYKIGSGRTYTYDTIEPNVAIADTEFQPPASRQSWTFAENDTVPVEVMTSTSPYGFAGRYLRFRATVNGQEGTFVLDSGAAGILISGPFAQRAGLEPIGDSTFSGINGGSERAHLALVKDITFGKSVLHNTVITYSDRNVLSQTEDGLMGYDMLANAIVDVDLDAKTMRFYDPAKIQPVVGPHAYAFPVDLSERVPRVKITINGTIPLQPLFDTGDADEVLLSQYILKHGVYTPTISGQAFFTGVDGTNPEPVPCSRILHMTVGPYQYTNVPVCFGTEAAFGKRDGLIGFDFLEHFNWTFDYPYGTLVLTPNTF